MRADVSEPTDAALLDAAHGGDHDAAAALITRHAARVVRFSRSLCSNDADADDVAQDALIAAFHGIGGVRDAAALPAWLYAVARRYCGKVRRGTRSQDASIDVGIAGPDPAPDDVAARGELRGALTQALRSLDPKYQDVVWMRDVEGLTAPEVARAVGVNVATVKTRLHRGRAQLRARIEPVLSTVQAGPACPDIVDRFSAFLDGDIGPDECSSLQDHVETCASCNAACEALKRTVALCKQEGAPVPLDVQERVRHALLVASGRS